MPLCGDLFSKGKYDFERVNLLVGKYHIMFSGPFLFCLRGRLSAVYFQNVDVPSYSILHRCFKTEQGGGGKQL